MRITDKHVLFFSYKDLFSNHHRDRVAFGMPHHLEQGVNFNTGEHFMMYEKAMLFGDEEVAAEVLTTWMPNEAKKLGRKVKNFNNIVWLKNRERIMCDILRCRMETNLQVRNQALQHRLEGKSFVEASPYDKIWGVGLAETDPLIDDPANWLGENLLGICWDRVVDEYIQKLSEGEH